MLKIASIFIQPPQSRKICPFFAFGMFGDLVEKKHRDKKGFSQKQRRIAYLFLLLMQAQIIQSRPGDTGLFWHP